MVTTHRRAEPPTARRKGDSPWARAMLLAPAVVGSVCTLVLLGRSRGVRRTLAGWLGRTSVMAELEPVRAAVVGRSKRRVTALYGPPPAATSAPTVTWYYPVAGADRLAMAVSFDGDRATRVEFFRSPG